MASTTPNIGLTLPTGTEGWKRSVINGNFTILDTKIGAVGNTPLQTQINTLSSQLAPTNQQWVSNANGNDFTTTGKYMIGSGQTNLPEGWGILTVTASRSDTILQEYEANQRYFYREYRTATGWTNWEQVALASQMAKGAFLSWGTSLTVNNFHHGLLLLGRMLFVVWFASSVDINVKGLSTPQFSKSGQNSVTFGDTSDTGTDYTVTRNGLTITVTSTGNSTISLLYV